MATKDWWAGWFAALRKTGNYRPRQRSKAARPKAPPRRRTTNKPASHHTKAPPRRKSGKRRAPQRSAVRNTPDGGVVWRKTGKPLTFAELGRHIQQSEARIARTRLPKEKLMPGEWSALEKALGRKLDPPSGRHGGR